MWPLSDMSGSASDYAEHQIRGGDRLPGIRFQLPRIRYNRPSNRSSHTRPQSGQPVVCQPAESRIHDMVLAWSIRLLRRSHEHHAMTHRGCGTAVNLSIIQTNAVGMPKNSGMPCAAAVPGRIGGSGKVVNWTVAPRPHHSRATSLDVLHGTTSSLSEATMRIGAWGVSVPMRC